MTNSKIANAAVIKKISQAEAITLYLERGNGSIFQKNQTEAIVGSNGLFYDSLETDEVKINPIASAGAITLITGVFPPELFTTGEINLFAKESFEALFVFNSEINYNIAGFDFSGPGYLTLQLQKGEEFSFNLNNEIGTGLVFLKPEVPVTTPVPEPLTILGSATALGIGGLLKREHSKKNKKS